jgi:LPS-assembly lipoprotein
MWRSLKLMTFLSVLFIAGCGFQLRGSKTFLPSLQNLYIQSTDPYGQLATYLATYLKQSGVHLTTTPDEATAILSILSETQNQQLISVSGTQQTRQYNLLLLVQFQVTNNKGAILVPPQSLTESRILTSISDQILGGSNEQTIMYQQMRRSMVYDMINRLGSQDVAAMIETTDSKTKK